MQLLRTILIIIIIYYLFKLFARYVMPYIARYFIRKSMKAHQQESREPERKTGEIHVDYSPQKKNRSQNLGEYIDYEEVKEDKQE